MIKVSCINFKLGYFLFVVLIFPTGCLLSPPLFFSLWIQFIFYITKISFYPVLTDFPGIAWYFMASNPGN